eukprot:11624335-Ditylum_brightwellii.AAC.1
MQTKSATMLTAEALVEKNNVSALILSKIIQDKVTHTLRVQKYKSDLENIKKGRRRRKQQGLKMILPKRFWRENILEKRKKRKYKVKTATLCIMKARTVKRKKRHIILR